MQDRKAIHGHDLSLMNSSGGNSEDQRAAMIDSEDCSIKVMNGERDWLGNIGHLN